MQAGESADPLALKPPPCSFALVNRDSEETKQATGTWFVARVVAGVLLLLGAGVAKAIYRTEWHDEYKFHYRDSTLRVPDLMFLPWLWKNHPDRVCVLAGLALAMIGLGWATARTIRKRGREYSCEFAAGFFVIAVAFALKGIAW